MIHRVVIPQYERGFLFREGDFERVLPPGVHWLFSWRRLEVKRVSQLSPRLVFPETEVLVRHPLVAPEVQVHRIKDTERGLVFKDGNFTGFLPPGLHAFLNTPTPLTVEVVDISGIELVHPRREVLMAAPGASAFLKVIEVPEGQRAVLFLGQVRSRVLEPGRHPFWLGLKTVEATVLDLREQALEIQGQELMTQDKVSLRVNLSVRMQVTDPVVATSTQVAFRDAVYRDLQLALREEVGRLTLEELLGRKDDLGAAVLGRARPAAAAMGVALHAAGLRDVILPGEMRTILNQVIEAEKRAQANMITRREETASTRNLLNTAKLLEHNPLLLHLKELESVERIAEKIGSLSVYGGLDGLVASLKGLLRREPDPDPPAAPVS